jgi:DNA polymerase (family X)
MAAGKTEVVEALKEIAFGIELEGGNGFQVRAFANAAQAIKRVESDIRELYDSGQLAQIKGVGKSTLRVVEDVLEGRTPPAIVSLREKLGPGMYAIGKLKGLGPAKVRTLWQELGVASVGELEYACLENRLVDLPGFGRKSQQAVLEAIRESREVKAPDGEERFRRDVALAAARKTLTEIPNGRIVGELAGGVETVALVEILTDHAGEAPLLADGLPLRVHRAPTTELGSAEVRLTSDEAHWKALADRAASRGVGMEAPTPEALYALLGLHTVAPEQRRAGTILVGIDAPRPELVRLEDLKGSLHNHTEQSDGVDTLEAMVAAARRLGHEYIAITDHSQSAKYARGLEPERLDRQIETLRRLRTEGPPFILSGIESDILPDGALDYPPEILEALDVVVASIHNRNRMDKPTLTARIVRAVEDPHTAILGHPTGRLLLSRPPAEIDMAAVLDACARAGVAVELNAHPHRLDLNVEHLEMARERGVPVSINADAHIGGGLLHLEHGIAVARRAGLRPEEVLNTRPLAALQAAIAAGRERRATS